MRIVLFGIWTVFGFCLFLAGCRASLRAADLEASFEFRAAHTPIIEVVTVGDDKVSVKPE